MNMERRMKGKKRKSEERSITASDGVADWCGLANAELPKPVTDGWLVFQLLFILSLIYLFVCVCRAVGFH